MAVILERDAFSEPKKTKDQREKSGVFESAFPGAGAVYDSLQWMGGMKPPSVSSCVCGGGVAAFALYAVMCGTTFGLLSGVGRMQGLFCRKSAETPQEKEEAVDFLDEAKEQGQEMLSFAVSAWKDALEQGFNVARFAKESLAETQEIVDETEKVAHQIIESVQQASVGHKIIPLNQKGSKKKKHK